MGMIDGHNSCWDTNIPGHSRVWAQSRVGTIMSGHNHVLAQSSSCIIATYTTKFIISSWYEMSVYYVFYIFQSQAFFQINKRFKNKKRPVIQKAFIRKYELTYSHYEHYVFIYLRRTVIMRVH